MPRAKPFDKKTATTYALVNRPQHDPFIHDSDAPSQVFAEVPSSSKQGIQSKIKRRHDLERELDLSASIRDNEGEAAEYGIYFDDTSYDYMQHMRELGGSKDATWIEPSTSISTDKAKSKVSLEDSLRDASLEDYTLRESLVENRDVKPPTWRQNYEIQQDVPEALAGFQPDMDPRLREVLEALEDDDYVDDDDDIFVELAADGNDEVEQYEWEANHHHYEEDEEAWESDDTTKPAKEYHNGLEPQSHSEDHSTLANNLAAPDSVDDGAWLASFTKSKGLDSVAGPNPPQLPLSTQNLPQPSDLASSAALTSASQLSRRKKRKGALTSSAGYSMSSSAIARTEPLSTLDSRFDKIAEYYLEDESIDENQEGLDDHLSVATGISARTSMSRASANCESQISEAPSIAPARFDAILDDFLGCDSSGKQKGRAMKKAGKQGRWGIQSGMEQLDEIRKGLGSPRIKTGQPKMSTV